MQGIPIFHAIGLGNKAWVGAPGGCSHRIQPRYPLFFFARGNRGVTVARRQDRYRCAIAVAQALTFPALAAQTRPGEFGHGERRQGFVDRYIDGRTELTALRRMHAGTSGSQSADERRLLTHRTYWRLR